MTEPAKLTDLTRADAEKIAETIDPRAGGFFKESLVKAALLAAHEQRMKLERVHNAAQAAAVKVALKPVEIDDA
jgi:hypothetical protein